MPLYYCVKPQRVVRISKLLPFFIRVPAFHECLKYIFKRKIDIEE